MSTAPLTAAEPLARMWRAAWSAPRRAAFAVALSIGGLFAICSTCLALWAMWRNDPLKSIGGLIPLVSLVLILRVWRSLGWEMEGSWWGLLLLAFTIAVVHWRDQAVLELILSPSWSITIPPYSAVAVAYTTGVILLFGGSRLLRGSWFPVLLMWFVNPVPHFFNRYVDLPLQHSSAVIARGFAHALGQPLTPDQLSLMFTPQFGMFIAPGCNGIRGAVTMGLIALVASYLYRLRWWHGVVLTVGAVALGYLFNFIRLCLLVVYYVVALRHPWMQNHAAMGDYVLGACLFFGAAILLFALLQRWTPRRTLQLPPVPPVAPGPAATSLRSSLLFRCAAFIALVTVGSVSYARALMRAAPSAMTRAEDESVFPRRVGLYALQREWNETMATGQVVFHWAEYRAANGGRVSIGVSPALGAHDTLICHAARGDDWSWHGPLELATAAGPVSLSASLFNTGSTQYLEAAAVCSGNTCGQSSSERKHLGFIYSHPSVHALLTQDPARPIPILLRTETSNAALSEADARSDLTRDLADFLSGADLAAFTQPYRKR